MDPAGGGGVGDTIVRRLTSCPKLELRRKLRAGLGGSLRGRCVSALVETAPEVVGGGGTAATEAIELVFKGGSAGAGVVERVQANGGVIACGFGVGAGGGGIVGGGPGDPCAIFRRSATYDVPPESEALRGPRSTSAGTCCCCCCVAAVLRSRLALHLVPEILVRGAGMVYRSAAEMEPRRAGFLPRTQLATCFLGEDSAAAAAFFSAAAVRRCSARRQIRLRSRGRGSSSPVPEPEPLLLTV